MLIQLIKVETKDGVEALGNIIDDRNKKSIKRLIQQMNENAVQQTDIAIKALLDKFSLKKILPQIGSHSKVKKD